VANEVGKRLIWFTGRECPHCKQTRPVVERLIAETGVKTTELEVWHNEENARFMRRLGDVMSKACGGDLGVPSFYNERTGKAICGRIAYENLKKWALE